MANCKAGYRREDGRCVRIVKRIYSSIKEHGVKNARNLAIILLIPLALITVINISDMETVKAMIISFVFVISSIAVLSIKEFQTDALGINMKTIGINVISGAVFALGFILISSIVPYFSLAYPSYPESIGSSLRWFLVVIISPLTETLFFQCVIFTIFKHIFKIQPGRKSWISIVIASVAFSAFHLGAYILGFYSLDVTQGWTALTTNLSAFITAFLFSLSVMLYSFRNGIEKANLVFIIVVHTILNLFSYGFYLLRFV